MHSFGKILVTGATGFVGGRIARFLHRQGIEVVATGRNLQQGELLRREGIPFVVAHLELEDSIADLVIGCDAIVHAAALSAPWGRYQDFFAANVLATRYLIEAARQARVQRMIYLSTPSIYNRNRHQLGIRETDPLPTKMINHYSTTKYLAELAVLSSGMEAIALRPRAIMGRGDTVIMPRVLKAYKAGRLKRIGKGDNLADLTAAANVEHAILCALQAGKDALGKAYNITDGQPVVLWNLIDEMLSMLHLDSVKGSIPFPVAITIATLMETFSFFTGREPVLTRHGIAGLYYNLTLDISRARNYLGYVPIQTTGEALAEFVDWYGSSYSGEIKKV